MADSQVGIDSSTTPMARNGSPPRAKTKQTSLPIGTTKSLKKHEKICLKAQPPPPFNRRFLKQEATSLYVNPTGRYMIGRHGMMARFVNHPKKKAGALVNRLQWRGKGLWGGFD